MRSTYTLSLYIENNDYYNVHIAFHDNLKITNESMFPKCVNYDMRLLVFIIFQKGVDSLTTCIKLPRQGRVITNVIVRIYTS